MSHILAKQSEVPIERSLLVGISGLDGSGQGFVTAKLIKQIQKQDINAAQINVDGWLNLPHVRFNPSNPAAHFYENAIRLEEMFAKLILPLRENRSIQLNEACA